MSDTFIFELALQTNPEQESILETRMDAGRNLYNACLSESLRRLSLVKESLLWKKARNLPKSKERSKTFREAIIKQKFSEYDLHFYAKEIARNCFIGDHIDSQVAQTIATRAFRSADEYCKNNKGKPRFKGKGQFSSLEGKSNVTGIRFKDGKIIWQKLVLNPIFDPLDKDSVEAHALSCRTKYVRIIRRVVKGKKRYFAQLIQEGKPFIKKKHIIAKGKKVGLDIGPSSIAYVSEEKACLKPFCQELKKQDEKIRTLLKSLDRSRRAMNPGNYTEKGTLIKGAPWKRSKRYRRTQAQINEAQRKMAATRKTLHGTLCNEILSYGNIIQTEKLSYKSFQINFGRSTTHRAPGMFIEILRRKAGNADGKVIEFSPYQTKLSQTCHCGKKQKKPLKERWHTCQCGIEPVQRDLYSAFLALHVNEGVFDRTQAAMAWASAGPLLRQALSKCEETATGEQRLSSFGFSQRQSGLPVEGGSADSKVKDDVQRVKPLESLEELFCLATRTPSLSYGERVRFLLSKQKNTLPSIHFNTLT